VKDASGIAITQRRYHRRRHPTRSSQRCEHALHPPARLALARPVAVGAIANCWRSAVPTWNFYEHVNSGDRPAFLFSFSDAPVMKALSLYRDESRA
jgi:hypothetical protein